MWNRKRKMANERRKKLLTWIEEILELSRKSREWETQEEYARQIIECKGWSKEMKASWAKVRERLDIQDRREEIKKEKAEYYAELKIKVKEKEEKNDEMYARLPKSIKRTIKNKDEFMQGIMSKKTLKRLKILCLRCRAILLFQEE
ncbi:MAG: hypothetical protein IJX75_05610 [Clostridia bacterium]|nr:hypothetical protein [Clostridia bacterium]